MTSKVLSVRVDSELLDRLNEHAARRQVTVQDYVISLLVRDDFDERFKSAVEETERFYGDGQRPAGHQGPAHGLGTPNTPGGPTNSAPSEGSPRGPEATSSMGTPLFASPYPAQRAPWFGQADTGTRDGFGGWRPGGAS